MVEIIKKNLESEKDHDHHVWSGDTFMRVNPAAGVVQDRKFRTTTRPRPGPNNNRVKERKS